MSGRPRTTSFAEGNKQPPNPVLGGMKVTSKYPLAHPQFSSQQILIAREQDTLPHAQTHSVEH